MQVIGVNNYYAVRKYSNCKHHSRCSNLSVQNSIYSPSFKSRFLPKGITWGDVFIASALGAVTYGAGAVTYMAGKIAYNMMNENEQNNKNK